VPLNRNGGEGRQSDERRLHAIYAGLQPSSRQAPDWLVSCRDAFSVSRCFRPGRGAWLHSGEIEMTDLSNRSERFSDRLFGVCQREQDGVPRMFARAPKVSVQREHLRTLARLILVVPRGNPLHDLHAVER